MSVVLTVALVALSLAILPQRRRPAWILTLIVIAAMGKFYGHELVLGQVNLLFAVIVTAAILTLRANREIAAAMLFVAAVVVKPYAILFLPWLAVVRGFRAIAGAVAGLAALLAVPVLLYGVDGSLELHRAWWTTVTASTAPNLTNADNVSVAGMFAKWMGVGPAASASSLAVAAALVAAAVFVIASRRGIDYPEGARRGLAAGADPAALAAGMGLRVPRCHPGRGDVRELR